MTPRDQVWKWLAYGVAMVLAAILNYYVLAALPLIAVPLLLPVMAVAAGVLEGAAFGAGFGLAAGLLMCAMTHGSAAWIVVLPLFSLLCGLLAQYVLRKDFWGFVPACLCALLLWELGQILPRLVSGAAPLTALLRVAVPEYLWTALFAVPAYGLCNFCCRHYGRIYHE